MFFGVCHLRQGGLILCFTVTCDLCISRSTQEVVSGGIFLNFLELVDLKTRNSGLDLDIEDDLIDLYLGLGPGICSFCLTLVMRSD